MAEVSTYSNGAKEAKGLESENQDESIVAFKQTKCKLLVELMIENIAKQYFKDLEGDDKNKHQSFTRDAAILFDVLKILMGKIDFKDEELKEIIHEKYVHIQNGKPLIRKVLGAAWYVKISMNVDLKEDIMRVVQSSLSNGEKKKFYQLIIDKYFDKNDYDTMTCDEMQWYVEQFRLSEYGREIPICDDQFFVSATNSCFENVTSEITKKLVEVRTEFGLQKQYSSIATQVDLITLGGLQDQIISLKKIVAEKDRELKLKDFELRKHESSVSEMGDKINSLQERVKRLTKKSTKDYVALCHDVLLKKCLQFAGSAKDLYDLSEKILRSENYDDNAVASLAKCVCSTIKKHLFNASGNNRVWTEKYLLSCCIRFGYETSEYQRMVTSLLRLYSTL